MKDKIMQYVSYNQILRYLHYNGTMEIETSMHRLIQDALDEALTLSTFQSHYQFEPVQVDSSRTTLSKRTIVFESNDLAAFLKDSELLFMAGVTLGHALTKRIENRMLLVPSYGIMLDACASVLVDAFCDYLQEQMIETHVFGDNCVSQRYSPGYGDLNVTENKKIAEILKLDKKIGLYTTDYGQMVPEKSVIFVMGVSPTPYNTLIKTCGGSCETCLLKHCTYRRGRNGI